MLACGRIPELLTGVSNYQLDSDSTVQFLPYGEQPFTVPMTDFKFMNLYRGVSSIVLQLMTIIEFSGYASNPRHAASAAAWCLSLSCRPHRLCGVRARARPGSETLGSTTAPPPVLETRRPARSAGSTHAAPASERASSPPHRYPPGKRQVTQ